MLIRPRGTLPLTELRLCGGLFLFTISNLLLQIRIPFLLSCSRGHVGNKITVRDFGALGIGLAFIYIGIDHFINPIWYEPIVPSLLPDATFWVLISGFFEIIFGLMLIIRKTRAWASVGIAWMLVLLYWANFNMWYNNIPIGGNTYDEIWHIVRLIIQIMLIALVTWIGQVTPFKGREILHDSLDIFEGRITSSGFDTGDRIVVGSWKLSPFGEFSDIMWAKPDGQRVLIAPSKEIADYISAMYSFDKILIQEISTIENDRTLTLNCESMKLNFSWSKGLRIPIKRSLLFIATVELFIARIFFSTKTHGITRNGRKEWYAIDRLSKLKSAQAQIADQDLGQMAPIEAPCKFGFSEAPKKPSSCEVRTHIL